MMHFWSYLFSKLWSSRLWHGHVVVWVLVAPGASLWKVSTTIANICPSHWLSPHHYPKLEFLSQAFVQFPCSDNLWQVSLWRIFLTYVFSWSMLECYVWMNAPYFIRMIMYLGLEIQLGFTLTELLTDLGTEMTVTVGNPDIMERMEGLFH